MTPPGTKSGSSTILDWIGNDGNKKRYALCYGNDLVVYFESEEKGKKYMKHIAAMIIKRLSVINFPEMYRLDQTERGYMIKRCIWNIFIPIYISVCEIKLMPIFEM